jgi:peptidyl-prolyl cis-trans isomerase SurA
MSSLLRIAVSSTSLAVALVAAVLLFDRPLLAETAGDTPGAGDASEAAAEDAAEDDPFLADDPYDESESFDSDDPFGEDEAPTEEQAAQPDSGVSDADGAVTSTAADEDAAFEQDDPFDEDAAFEQDDPFIDDAPVEDEVPLDEADLGAFFGPSPSDQLLENQEWPKSDSEALVEGIAAQVGGGVVLVSEVVRLAAPVEERMRASGVSEPEIRAVRSEALDRLIESRLIEDVVQRAQLSATEAEVDQAIAAIASENGLTVEQMGASIASHGLTVEEYRAKIKGEIERNKVVGSMVRSRVHIEESDVEALYQMRYAKQRESGSELHLAHLLIATGAKMMRTEETACMLANKIRTQVLDGEMSFSAAAAQYSDTNSDRGGDLGWVHGDELASWMAPAVSDLEAGEISKVVPMYFGCNLLKLVDRRDFKPITLDDARPELQEIVFRQKMEEEYRLWIEKLRDTVYVERKGVYAEASRLGDRAASR